MSSSNVQEVAKTRLVKVIREGNRHTCPRINQQKAWRVPYYSSFPPTYWRTRGSQQSRVISICTPSHICREIRPSLSRVCSPNVSARYVGCSFIGTTSLCLATFAESGSDGAYDPNQADSFGTTVSSSENIMSTRFESDDKFSA